MDEYVVARTDEDIAFNEWMQKVDLAVFEVAWCSVYDLEDCAFRDMYDDGAEPAEAANRVLEDAGFLVREVLHG